MKTNNNPDWLSAQTGRSLPNWILYIQKRIVKRSRPSKDPNHDETDTAAWMADLEKEVRKSWKKADRQAGKKYDGNMRIAATIGMILCAWYCRVQLAKTQDPNRPVKLRQEAYQRWLGWHQAHCAALADSQYDPELFQGQEWESPFLPGARDGRFV